MSTEVTQEQLEAVNDILLGGANVGTKTTTASQNATQNQSTTASNTQESEGSSTQTSSVEYKPVEQRVYDENKALEYMKSMPFVDAMKLAGIEKPDPKVLEDAKRRQKYRANAATLAETLRVLSDIGSGFAGGNVYQRENKDVEKANADYDKEETAYNAKLNSYQQQLLQGILNDRATKLNLLNDIEKTFGRQTKTESENKQTNKTESSQNTTSNSSQNSSQTINGDNRVARDADGNYVYSYGRGGSGSKNYSISLTTENDGVKREKNIEIKGGEQGWKSYLNKASKVILQNPDLVNQIVSEFGGDEDEVRAIISNTKRQEGGEGKVYDYEQKRIQYILSVAGSSQQMLDLLDAGIELGSDGGASSSTSATNPSDSTTLWQWNN